MSYKSFKLILFIIISGFGLQAQVQIPFDSLNWDIRAREHQFTNYKGQEALMIRAGTATHEAVNFEDGIIEWDMAFSEERGFSGIRFRMQDFRNFEEFYCVIFLV